MITSRGRRTNLAIVEDCKKIRMMWCFRWTLVFILCWACSPSCGFYSVLLSNSTENVQSQKSHVWRRQHTNRFLKSKSNSFKIIVNTSNLIWSSCIMQCLVGCPQNFLPIKISSVCTDVSKFSFKNRISIEWEMMRYTLIAKIRIYKFSAKEANIIRSSLTIHRCLLIRRF